MTAPIDKARLREAIERVKQFADALSTEGEVVTIHPLAGNSLAKSFYIMIDALSAERERGDRAVGLLRRWRAVVAPSEALEDITDAFLATQKAEGAET